MSVAEAARLLCNPGHLFSCFLEGETSVQRNVFDDRRCLPDFLSSCRVTLAPKTAFKTSRHTDSVFLLLVEPIAPHLISYNDASGKPGWNRAKDVFTEYARELGL